MNNVPRDLRIAVVGTSGCSTLSAILSRQFMLPRIGLKQNGHRLAPESWQHQATPVTGDSWVLAGDSEAVREQVWPRASMIVWLDFAHPWVLGHALLRAVRHMVRRGFSRRARSPGHMLRLAWEEHQRRRAEYPAMLDTRWVRLQSLKDTHEWLRDMRR